MHLADRNLLSSLPDFRAYFDAPYNISSIKLEKLFQRNWKIFISGHDGLMDCIPWLRSFDRLEGSQWFLMPISEIYERPIINTTRRMNNFLRLEAGDIERDLEEILFDDCKIICPLHGRYFLVTYFLDVCIYVIVEPPGPSNNSGAIAKHLSDACGLPHHKNEVIEAWDKRDSYSREP